MLIERLLVKRLIPFLPSSIPFTSTSNRVRALCYSLHESTASKYRTTIAKSVVIVWPRSWKDKVLEILRAILKINWGHSFIPHSVTNFATSSPYFEDF